MGANSFLQELTPIEKGNKNENGRVPSPVKEAICLIKVYFVFQFNYIADVNITPASDIVRRVIEESKLKHFSVSRDELRRSKKLSVSPPKPAPTPPVCYTPVLQIRTGNMDNLGILFNISLKNMSCDPILEPSRSNKRSQHMFLFKN